MSSLLLEVTVVAEEVAGQVSLVVPPESRLIATYTITSMRAGLPVNGEPNTYIYFGKKNSMCVSEAYADLLAVLAEHGAASIHLTDEDEEDPQ
jgi:hypothetical protein